MLCIGDNTHEGSVTAFLYQIRIYRQKVHHATEKAETFQKNERKVDKHCIAGTTARSRAERIGINRNTAAK